MDNKLTDIKVSAIFRVLKEKYHNDLSKYALAEKEVDGILSVKKRLNYLNDNINNISCSQNKGYTKSTYVNLNSKIAYIEETDDSNIDSSAVLAYSYDYLTVRRLFPFSLDTYLNTSRVKDNAKAKKNEDQERVYDIFKWVRSRLLDNQFTLNSITVNKSNGTLQYNTLIRDNNFGTVAQYITAVIDPSRVIHIDNTDITDNMLKLSTNSNLLFNYFILFGFTEFYARCTCQDYYRKYAKKRGVANYFCSHILYSMAQLPYYAMYYLNS